MTTADRTPLLYVVIDDQRAPVDLTRAVLEFSVDEHAKKATKISLTLDDPDQRYRALLPEGATIAVRWGWPGSLSSPRGGIIHKVSYSNDDLTLSVEAYGKELALSKGVVRRTFRAKTLRQAIETLARGSGLTVDWQAPDTITFDGSVIDNETAWSWIQRRTAELGLVTTVEGGRLLVREPPLDAPPTRVLLWGWRGSTMLSFEVEEHTKKSESEHEGVVAVFVDPASGASLKHAAGSPNTTRRTLAARRLEASRRQATRAEEAATRTYVEAHPELADRPSAEQTAAWRASTTQRAAQARPPTEDEPTMLSVLLDNDEVRPASTAVTASTAAATGASAAAQGGRQTSVAVAAPASAARQHARRVAEGRFKEHERGKVTAKASMEGEPSLRRGDVVRVLGTAERDAGLWYVEACLHKHGTEGYVTDVELKRDGVNGGRGGRRAGTVAQGASAATSGSTSGAGATANDRVAVDLERESA